MSLALDMAKKAAEFGEVPVGALIVKGEEVIASAFNQPITTHDACAHAEILAIRAAGEFLQNYRLVDCSLYVTLEPCTMCFGAMVHSRISRLIYGAGEPKAGVVSSQMQLPEQGFFNHSFDITGGVLAEECSSCLSAFFKNRRSQKKLDRLSSLDLSD